jgi:hypothetical protein
MRAVTALRRRYNLIVAQEKALRAQLTDATVAALRAGDEPAEVSTAAGWTPTHVRRLAKAAGFPVRKAGRKPKQHPNG